MTPVAGKDSRTTCDIEAFLGRGCGEDTPPPPAPHTEKLRPWALLMGNGDLTSEARQTSLPHYPGDTTSLVIYPSLSSPRSWDLK